MQTGELHEFQLRYPTKGWLNINTVRNGAMTVGLGVDYYNHGAPSAVYVPGLVTILKGPKGQWRYLDVLVLDCLALGVQCGLERDHFARTPNFRGHQVVGLRQVMTWPTPVGRVARELGDALLADLDALSDIRPPEDPEIPFGHPSSPREEAQRDYTAAVWDFAWALGYLGGGTHSVYNPATRRSQPHCRRVTLQEDGFLIRLGGDPENARATALLTFPVRPDLLPHLITG